MVTPIRPDEVVKAKEKQLPPEVIESFNEMIARNFDGRVSQIKQKEVVALIMDKLPAVKRDTVFDNHWLDVEDMYRQYGWKVEYEQPSYADSPFDPYYKFYKK
jgi:hypothetical protein